MEFIKIFYISKRETERDRENKTVDERERQRKKRESRGNKLLVVVFVKGQLTIEIISIEIIRREKPRGKGVKISGADETD